MRNLNKNKKIIIKILISHGIVLFFFTNVLYFIIVSLINYKLKFFLISG